MGDGNFGDSMISRRTPHSKGEADLLDRLLSHKAFGANGVLALAKRCASSKTLLT
jgi:hypothetical protein